MSNNELTEQRVQELIDAWGADSARWPEQEREAALCLVASSPHLQARLDEAAALDRMLGRAGQTTRESSHLEQLSARIMENLPPQQTLKGGDNAGSGMMAWLQSLMGGSMRGLAAFASVLVLVFATLLVVDYNDFTDNRVTVTSSEFDRWAWEQATGEVVNGSDSVDNMVVMLAPEIALQDNDL